MVVAIGGRRLFVGAFLLGSLVVLFECRVLLQLTLDTRLQLQPRELQHLDGLDLCGRERKRLVELLLLSELIHRR